ncbi:protein YgfX [Vibrio sp. SCSIO 43135]|uniref:protein YgfX n=1 Tax=Vibrio sp. SCSIO 43135 TaxID=2819096 RepID=UPI0033657B76
MSLTTLARCANLNLAHSSYAHFANTVVLVFAMWALIVSPIPLVITLYLALIVAALYLKGGFFPAPLKGKLTVKPGNILEVNNQSNSIRHAQLAYSWLAILITYSDGKRYCLWRDSLCEADYRRVVAELKREQ